MQSLRLVLEVALIGVIHIGDASTYCVESFKWANERSGQKNLNFDAAASCGANRRDSRSRKAQGRASGEGSSTNQYIPALQRCCVIILLFPQFFLPNTHKPQAIGGGGARDRWSWRAVAPRLRRAFSMDQRGQY